MRTMEHGPVRMAHPTEHLIDPDAPIPQHAPMIGRPVEDHNGLRELIIDFGVSGYLALY